MESDGIVPLSKHNSNSSDFGFIPSSNSGISRPPLSFRTDLKHPHKAHDHTKEPLSTAKHPTSNKGKSEFRGSEDVLSKTVEISCVKKTVPTIDGKSHIKPPVDDDEAETSTSSENLVLNSNKVEVGQSKSQITLQQPMYGSLPSSKGSPYTASHYTEAKQSFVVTESSDCGSCVEKSGESVGEVSNSCDINVESRKMSIHRGSTGSEFSDDSSASSFSSALYKPHKANDIRWEAIHVVRSRERDLGLNHFRLLSRLGCGDIGSVYLSELNGTRTYFAMKIMDKADLVSRKKLPRAQTEKEILQALDHPFLPTLYSHFETQKFTCLVMEFCNGGDLHALRQRQHGKYFPEHAARFYVAEVLLALEYLHMLGIIYRDLKPENVLVREDGHIMLSDFDLSLRCAVCPTLVRSSNTGSESKNSGYCIEPNCVMQPACMQPACFGPRLLSGKPKKEKKVKAKKPDIHNQVIPLPELVAEPTNARSMSFVGTHEYLAPEIIKGEGHGSAVDWWAFGIFLYELLYGKTPFKGSGNRATLFNVLGQPLKFPDTPTVSFAARDLIRGLLVKEPQHRLAYRRGATELKQHPFFQSVNWALIRCTTPPEVPGPLVMDFPTKPNIPQAPTATEKLPGVDVKASGNYLEIDFF